MMHKMWHEQFNGIKYYEGNFSINGEKVVKQIYVLEGDRDGRNCDTFKFYVIERNGKQGLYQLTRKGLKEYLPPLYDNIDATIQSGKCFIDVQNSKGRSLYYYDIQQDTLSKPIATGLEHIYSEFPFSNLWLFVYKNGLKSIFDTNTVKFKYKGFKKIETLPGLNEHFDEIFYIIYGQVTENGIKDRLFNVFDESVYKPNSVDFEADYIRPFANKNGYQFLIKNNGKVHFVQKNNAGNFVSKNLGVKISGAYIIEDELHKNKEIQAWSWSCHMEDILKTHLSNCPDMFLIVENNNNKKAIASLSKDFQYKCLTPYVFDDITLNKAYVQFWSTYEEDENGYAKADYGAKPIQIDFRVEKSGEKILITYLSESGEFELSKSPETPAITADSDDNQDERELPF